MTIRFYRSEVIIVDAYPNKGKEPIRIEHKGVETVVPPGDWVVMTGKEIWSMPDRAFRGLFFPVTSKYAGQKW